MIIHRNSRRSRRLPWFLPYFTYWTKKGNGEPQIDHRFCCPIFFWIHLAFFFLHVSLYMYFNLSILWNEKEAIDLFFLNMNFAFICSVCLIFQKTTRQMLLVSLDWTDRSCTLKISFPTLCFGGCRSLPLQVARSWNSLFLVKYWVKYFGTKRLKTTYQCNLVISTKLKM